MILATIQPSFMPWLGYLEQVSVADVFVLLDDVQYTKGDWRNRNRFKAPNGISYLTVPVSSGGSEALINEATIAETQPWRPRILNRLREWYRRAPYFDPVYEGIHEIVQREHELLSDLNLELLRFVMDYASIETPIEHSSKLAGISQTKTGKLLDICAAYGADVLYDGKSAANFISPEAFRERGVEVVFQDYQHPVYPQLWGSFESHLSVVDLLFNCGPDSHDVLLSSPRPGLGVGQ